MAMTSFAQEKNDTTYVMFDFNLNPWNYPVTTTIKGWEPDYDDEKGAIFVDKDFTWPLKEGSDKLITLTVYAVDLDEFSKPPVLARFENCDVKTKDEKSDSVMTMLFMKPGTMVRFKAPEGYKFGKMFFYDYRYSYYTLETEEKVMAYSFGSWHEDTHKIWLPSTPKKNQYGENCWEGDETNILFNNISNFKWNSMKIDMRLVPDGTAGIQEIQAKGSHEGAAVGLDGRAVNTTNPASLRKGIYVIDGKKYVVK
mgnify:CR=1 FL=1